MMHLFRSKLRFRSNHSLFLLSLWIGNFMSSPPAPHSNFLDSFFKLFRSTVAPKFGSGPVYILGRCYHNDDENKSVSDEQRLADIALDFSTRMWLTYRRDFPPMAPSTLTSDAGWGCTLRSGQMLLANALMWHFLGRGADFCACVSLSMFQCKQDFLVILTDFRLHPAIRRPQMYAQIARWFIDLPSPTCEFSLHRLLRADRRLHDPSSANSGESCSDRVGQWFGPHHVCRLLQYCVNSSVVNDEFSVVVADDGTLFWNRVHQAILPKDHNGPPDRAVLILIPLRLGLQQHIDSAYIPSLLECLSWPESVGFVGGRPGASLYFVGHHDFDTTPARGGGRARSQSMPQPMNTTNQSSAESRSPSIFGTFLKRFSSHESPPASIPSPVSFPDSTKLLFLDPHTVQSAVPLQANLLLHSSSAMQSPSTLAATPQSLPPLLSLDSPAQGMSLSSVVPQMVPHLSSSVSAALNGLHSLASTTATHLSSAANAMHAASFHCHTVRCMSVADLDPCLALGFYCRNATELDALWQRIEAQHSRLKSDRLGTVLPPFSISSEEPGNHDPSRVSDEVDADYPSDQDDDEFVLL